MLDISLHKLELSHHERRLSETMSAAALQREQERRLALNVERAERKRILAVRARDILIKAGVTFPPSQRRAEDQTRRGVIKRPTIPDRLVPTFDPNAFAIRVPPYDVDLFYPSGGVVGVSAAANKVDGTAECSAGVDDEDASRNAYAGVGIWSQAARANPMARFAAVIDYSYVWLADNAPFGGFADTHGAAVFNVWGYSEQKWVGFSVSDPHWDVAQDDFLGGGDVYSDEGRLSDDVIFPAQANSWYLTYVRAWIAVDAGSGLGPNGASGYLAIRVPLTVLTT